MKRPEEKTTKYRLGAFVALLFTLPLLLCLFGFVLPAQYDDTFLGEMKYKLQRLASTPGKRIVVIGGSSVPFSLKSELIEAHLPDYQVVDFGMYADMGTVVMLDFAKEYIHEGDIIILAPEQNAQTLSCHFSGEDVWQAVDGSFEMLSLISEKRYEALAADFPAFAGKKLRYALTGAPEVTGVYARSSFNEYGDISYPFREANILAGGHNPNDLISFEPEVPSPDFIDELNHFAREAVADGATVLYHFSPMNAAALAPGTTPDKINAYYDYLNELLLFPIIGNPHHCILDSGWFYDSNFHLNASGALVFTKLLIEDIKLWQKDSSVTAIALPSMPKPSITFTDGDNSDADCFTYTKSDNGWFINGLSETGQKETGLILPCIYEGEPVTGISDTLFAGNQLLQSVTFQPNISVLYDGMFDDCSSLKQLVLTGEDPSSYTVGDGLLEGGNFLIYVPENALDQYRRNYFWQKYDSWLQPMTALSE